MKNRLIFVALLSLLLLAAIPAAGLVDYSQSPRSAFGEMMVVEPRPVAAWKFDYNINPDIVITGTAGGGSVTHGSSMASLNTGTGITGTAAMSRATSCLGWP